jgi:hypothetical protein
MTPRVPKAVRIAGRDWSVRMLPRKKMKGDLGLTHLDRGLIDVATRQGLFDTRDTLLHEVFHAILRQQGRTTEGDETEELYVRALATGLMGVLQDNPEFAKWLSHPIPKKSP